MDDRIFHVDAADWGPTTNKNAESACFIDQSCEEVGAIDQEKSGVMTDEPLPTLESNSRI